MKKKMPFYLLAAVCLLLFVSLWKNFSYAEEKSQLKNGLLYDSYYALREIRLGLDELILGAEAGTLPDEECENKLISIFGNFTELHVSLKNFAAYFPASGTRNCYSGFPDFDFIGWTLVGGEGEINGSRYSCIMLDHAISDEELQYLSGLRGCTDAMMEAMAPAGDLEQISEISSFYLDEVISAFLGKFAPANEDNLVRLLFEE